MKTVLLVFPHQLFKESPLLEFDGTFVMMEEYLFFRQFHFHKQKITFHRATMKMYADHLKNKGKDVNYIDANGTKSDIRKFIESLSKVEKIICIDPTDNWIEKRMTHACNKANIKLEFIDSPLFINSRQSLQPFFKPTKKKFYQTSFYKSERTRLNILIEDSDKPAGGKWTYDTENRKKYPKSKTPPWIKFPKLNNYVEDAIEYVNTNFNNYPGELSKEFIYPTTYEQANEWFNQFLEIRFDEFGPYEDAIVQNKSILNHSLLSPLINVGLLTPRDVVDQSIAHNEKADIPINSIEGFIRQIIGWREFIRGVYKAVGSQMRTKNFWNFDRKIPDSFYDGSTGITPVDVTIKKVLQTGYCHHIERLMVLGNFMALCEFDPNEVYKWFMELFIDAYDWVMVPNVYGMSQYADGGMMSTKPYISSSNYLMKMSDYKKGDWQLTWDGLFWRFMDKHRDFFLKNPRMAMLIRTYDKMPDERKKNHLLQAEAFLSQLG